METKNFKDFGIEPPEEGFIGDKIKMAKVLNQEIIVNNFRIEKSNYEGKCLYLQITYRDAKRVIFTQGKALLDSIQKLTKDQFPFTTTIVEENDRFRFT